MSEWSLACKSHQEQALLTNACINGEELHNYLAIYSCDIVDHLQGSFVPFGPKSEKNLERGSRDLSAPGAQKV